MMPTKIVWRSEESLKRLLSKCFYMCQRRLAYQYRGAKYNDPRNLDPKGEYWTVEMIKEDGEFVIKRYIY